MRTVVDKLEKEILGVIKSQRYKTVKTTNRHPSGIFVTKIMTFSAGQPFQWVECQLQERVFTINQIQRTGYLHIQMDHILEAVLKIDQGAKTLFLTKRYVAGFSLALILQHKNELEIITKPENVKEIVWEMLSLLVNGGGFKNIIVTNENLIFQISGSQGFKPRLNYLSFVGFRLIGFQQEIDRDQYAQIAIFLDQEAYTSGQINRFQFKARNFACLILTLACGRDISEYVLKGLKLGPFISFQQAKNNHIHYVQPRLEKMVNFKSIQEKIESLKVPGLLEFIKTAFNLNQTKKLNWAKVQMMLFRQKSQHQIFQKMAQQLWDYEDEGSKRQLENKGMQYVKESPLVYLALKIGVCLQTLLKQNDWNELFRDERFNRWKSELWHRILAICKKMEKTNDRLIHLFDLGHEVLHQVQEISQRRVFMISHQKKALLRYPCYRP